MINIPFKVNDHPLSKTEEKQVRALELETFQRIAVALEAIANAAQTDSKGKK